MADDVRSQGADGPGHPTAAAEAPKPPEKKAVTGPKGINLPYTVPSRGVFYGDKCPGGQVIIYPIRGEQEELLAGAGEGVEATPVFRHVVAQLVDLGGLPYEDLLLSDWVALLLNLLAFSYDPIMRFRPRCPHCHKFFPKSINIEEMECKVVPEDKAHEWKEPFEASPLPMSSAKVAWKLLRLRDMVSAEDWARQQESIQTTPGSPLHTYTLAKHIISVNGEKKRILDAIDWVRDALARDLRALSGEFRKRETGYDLTPRFDCPHCGGYFRTRLPLDGSFFRAASSGPGESPPPEI